MAHQIVRCRYYHSSEVVHYGTQSGHDRFRCKTCRRTFKTEYTYRACEPGVKEQIRPMATNGSGVRDTSRVLGIGKNTVIAGLKKSATEVVDVNPTLGSGRSCQKFAICLIRLGKPRLMGNGAISVTRTTRAGYGGPLTRRRG